jgi:hypothetical protein
MVLRRAVDGHFVPQPMQTQHEIISGILRTGSRTWPAAKRINLRPAVYMEGMLKRHDPHKASLQPELWIVVRQMV